MARLVIVTHEFDLFAFRSARPPAGITSSYLLFDVLRHLETFGHSWRATRGPNRVDGDVALLHVDSTFVDETYLSLRSHYPRAINFGTGDISKRKVSSLRVTQADSWGGPVVVKANLNCGAIMEDLHNRRALRTGRPLPHPGVNRSGPYRLLERLEDVEEQVWADPALIVERFMPEIDDQGGFVIRTWVFMGSRERCTRTVAPGWIAKAAEAIRYEPAEVPIQLRAERERLNFDFGKFDFVMQNGTPILLDANRTPGTARSIESLVKAGARNLAEGLDELVRGAG